MSGPVERVVVVLDATAENRTAIDVAVRLAVRARAPLHAVFVEHEDLLSLAGLEVAREVVAGAGAGPLIAEQVELHLRAAAIRAEQDILAAAQIHALEYSFETVRGGAATAFSAASERDLVVAGALARPVAGHFQVESRWLSALELAPGPILLARKGGKGAGGIVVLLRERTTAAGRLLEAAARIMAPEDGAITVICPSALSAREGFAEWVDEQIEASTTRPRIEPIGAGATEGDPKQIREQSERLDCDVLIVP